MIRHFGRHIFDGAVMTGDGYPVRQKWTAPLLGTAVKIHANITLLTTTQTITTGITQPDFPRVLSITPTKAGSPAITGNVVITGTDIRGNVITDTIACGSDTVTVNGVKAFATVTSIAVPVRQTASDAISIGTTSLLGLKRIMDADEYLLGSASGTFEATRATVTYNATDISQNTVSFNTALNGTLVMRAVYMSKEKTTDKHTTN